MLITVGKFDIVKMSSFVSFIVRIRQWCDVTDARNSN